MAKDFDEGRGDRVPHPFVLCGETFVLKPSIPWALMVDLMKRVDAADGDLAETSVTVNQFFDAVLMKSDRQKFRDLLTDTDRDDPVDMQQVMAVYGWAMETLTGKASGESDNSSDGATSTPDLSTVDSSLRATGTDSPASPLRSVQL